jgi:cAMP-binding proteins - catabolite gene activator and regulatory subunit of cAMP-dependent protein kinases
MGVVKKFLKHIFIDDSLKEDISFLKKVSVFNGLSDRSLSKIALIVFRKTYVAGEAIYKEQHEANVLYIIKSGQVKIQNGKTEKTVEEEDFFGEIALIENRKHDSSSFAVKNSELYLIYRVKFDDMVDSNAKVGLRIMKNLASIFETRLRCAGK